MYYYFEEIKKKINLFMAALDIFSNNKISEYHLK